MSLTVTAGLLVFRPTDLRRCLLRGLKGHSVATRYNDRHIIYISVCINMYTLTVQPYAFRRNVSTAIDVTVEDHHAAQRQSSDLVTGDMGLITPINNRCPSCQAFNHTRTVECMV